MDYEERYKDLEYSYNALWQKYQRQHEALCRIGRLLWPKLNNWEFTSDPRNIEQKIKEILSYILSYHE